MASIQNLEAAFGKAANVLYEGLLDLNTPSAHVTQRVTQVLSMRDSLLAMYGVAQPPQKGKGVVQQPWQAACGKGAAQWQGQGAEMADTSTVDWKSKLIQLVSKRGKRSLTKGEMVFEVSAQDGGYVASLACTMLRQEYAGEELSPSKKQAEHAAAKMAIAAEFPDELGMGAPAAAPAVAWGGKGNLGWMGNLPGAGGGGTKRPLAAAAEGQQQERDNKSQLIHSLQMLLDRPVQKGDVEFETKLVDASNAQGGYVSILTLPTYQPTAAWEGETGEGKKQAEQNAAGQALLSLQELVGPAEEAHKAKKARLRKEKAAEQAAKVAEAG